MADDGDDLERRELPDVLYLVLRADEPIFGEWFVKPRDASMKATYTREIEKVPARVVKVTVASFERITRPTRRPAR